MTPKVLLYERLMISISGKYIVLSTCKSTRTPHTVLTEDTELQSKPTDVIYQLL